MAKKKEYRNKYKEARENPASAEGAGNGKGGKRKLTYKSYLVGIAIIAGIVAFFMQNEWVAIGSMVVFLIAGIVMGPQNMVFLAVGASMGVLIAVLNKTSFWLSISLIWTLFYIALMISGMFMTWRASRGK
ncbi:MAG: hypothetical protein HFE73_02950 [Firmicutes bacterium]|nr:hypothetical protein [Bacillota bacterium]